MRGKRTDTVGAVIAKKNCGKKTTPEKRLRAYTKATRGEEEEEEGDRRGQKIKGVQ